MSKKYEVWCYPTTINKSSKSRKVGGPYDNRDDALETKWFDEQDEPSPDKYDYFQWVIVETEEQP